MCFNTSGRRERDPICHEETQVLRSWGLAINGDFLLSVSSVYVRVIDIKGLSATTD